MVLFGFFTKSQQSYNIFFIYAREMYNFSKKSYFYTKIPHCEVQDS